LTTLVVVAEMVILRQSLLPDCGSAAGSAAEPAQDQDRSRILRGDGSEVRRLLAHAIR
jgi:hypothetical protein